MSRGGWFAKISAVVINKGMKVRYTLPATGVLQTGSDDPITLRDWSFQFEKDVTTGFISKLVVEISKVPSENWPTQTLVRQDPTAKIPRFPFETNKNVLRFSEIEPKLRNLEGILSVFGLERFEFGHLREEWIREEGDEIVGMLSGFSVQPGKREPLSPPLSSHQLARCIVASNTPETDALFLAYFRVAQSHFLDRLYIETIKFSYLCLESLFSNGKTKNKAILDEFKKNAELSKIVSSVLFESPTGLVRQFLSKHPDVASTSEVLTFFVQLRGRLQHANRHPALSWHPSNQREFEYEAGVIFTIAEEICFSRVKEKMKLVPTSPISPTDEKSAIS
jgi:hypothetical protein